MSNLTKLFKGLVSEGIKSMEAIADPEKKALVAAELAKSIAMTGMVGHTDYPVELSAEDAAETKEAIKADDAKATAKKEEAPAAEPAVAEEKPAAKPKPKPKPAPKPAAEEAPPAEEAAPAEEAVQEAAADENEWTDEAVEKYAAELEFIQALKDGYGDEGDDILNDCVDNWSEGVYKSTADITPANISGFKAYLEMLLADAQ